MLAYLERLQRVHFPVIRVPPSRATPTLKSRVTFALAELKRGMWVGRRSWEYFAVTDVDVVFSLQAPVDTVQVYARILEQYPNVTVVGPALRIDDFPDWFPFRNAVVNWEGHIIVFPFRRPW